VKRISELWGKSYKRGYIIWKPQLRDALRLSDFVEYKGMVLSTKALRDALDVIPSQDVLVSVNGGLQLDEIRRYFVPNPAHPGTRHCKHRMVKYGDCFIIKANGKTEGVGVILKLKVKQYAKN
jgi:hypothetical protein